MGDKELDHNKQQNMHDETDKDLDFMSELDAMRRMKAIPAANALLYSIAGLFVLFVLWASFFKIEEIVRGQGQVVPSSDLQVVQSLEGGILSELHIQEGDRVEKGQSLARISNEAFASEERGIEARFHALTLKQMRLQALVDGQEFIIPDAMKDNYQNINASEMALHQSRLEEIAQGRQILEDRVQQAEASLREVQAQVKRWKQNQGLLAKELRMTRNLAAQKAVPELEVIRLERDVNELSGNIEAGAQKIAALSAELRGNQSQLSEYDARTRTENLKEITETQASLAGLRESLSSAGDRVDRTELTAPSSGVVKKIHVKTIGGIVQPAMEFIEIVPVEDDLKISAKVNPSDIAFLKVGQPVNVKITAYDSQRFGSLEGTLRRISADSETDEQGNIFFEIDVVTKKNHLGTKENPLPITPGMVAETEIITGKRSIMTYLLKPFLRAKDRALTEK